MAILRFNALKETLHRTPVKVQEDERRSDMFGRNVFNQKAMRQYLTKDAYESLKKCFREWSKK